MRKSKNSKRKSARTEDRKAILPRLAKQAIVKQPEAKPRVKKSKSKPKMKTKEAPAVTAYNPPVEYEWRTQTAMPPPNGRAGTNTGDWAANVASIYVSAKDRFGADVTSLITKLVAGNKLRLEHSANAAIVSNWNVTAAPTAASGYFTIPVTRIDASAPPNGGNNVLIYATTGAVVTDPLTLGTALRAVLQRIWDDRQLRYRVVNGIRYCAVCGGEETGLPEAHTPWCLQGPMAKAMYEWDQGTGTSATRQLPPVTASSPVSLLPKP